MSIKINQTLFIQLIDMVENTNIFDVELWNRIKSDLMSDKEQKKYEVVKNILFSGLDCNIHSVANSCGNIFTLIACCFQVLFKFNVEKTKEKLLEWMETGNENEGEYLDKATAVKAVNQFIDGFNRNSAKEKILSSVRCFSKIYHDRENEVELMIEFIFKDKYEC